MAANNYVIFSRHDEHRLGENLLTTSHTYFEFGLRSCGGAVVALAASEQRVDYILRIGTDSNSNTVLQQNNHNGS